MKPTTALIIGAGALAIFFIWSRSKSTSLTAPKSTTTSNLLSLGGGILGGLGAGLLVSPGASSGTSTNTSSSSFVGSSFGATETPASIAAGNAIADSTAASDTSSGVVGFGGWDDSG